MNFRSGKPLLRNAVVFWMMLLVFVFGREGIASAGKGPEAFLPQTVYDFGAELEGNPVVHDFVIQNRGEEPLIIQRVRTG